MHEVAMNVGRYVAQMTADLLPTMIKFNLAAAHGNFFGMDN